MIKILSCLCIGVVIVFAQESKKRFRFRDCSSKWIYLINECLLAFSRVKLAIKLCIEHDTNVYFLSNFVWVNNFYFYWYKLTPRTVLSDTFNILKWTEIPPVHLLCVCCQGNHTSPHPLVNSLQRRRDQGWYFHLNQFFCGFKNVGNDW